MSNRNNFSSCFLAWLSVPFLAPVQASSRSEFNKDGTVKGPSRSELFKKHKEQADINVDELNKWLDLKLLSLSAIMSKNAHEGNAKFKEAIIEVRIGLKQRYKGIKKCLTKMEYDFDTRVEKIDKYGKIIERQINKIKYHESEVKSQADKTKRYEKIIKEQDEKIGRVRNQIREFFQKFRKSLKCPVKMEVFKNPMLTADGQSYEHKVIRKWLTKKEISPLTNKKLPNKNLTPNWALKRVIDVYRENSKTLRQIASSPTDVQCDDSSPKDVHVQRDDSRPTESDVQCDA